MKNVSLPDETGVVWQLYEGDTIRPYVDALLLAGYPEPTIILPRELLLSSTLRPPDWATVNEVWEREGDGPAFRRVLDIAITRHALGQVLIQNNHAEE